MAPPESLATLPDSVQPTIFIVPWALLLIAPPSPPEVAVPAELPDRVLLWIVASPEELKMPPPKSLAKLPDSVQPARRGHQATLGPFRIAHFDKLPKPTLERRGVRYSPRQRQAHMDSC